MTSAERAIEFDCVMINRRFLAARDTPNESLTPTAS